MVNIDADCLAKLSKISQKLPWRRAYSPGKIKKGVSFVEKKVSVQTVKRFFKVSTHRKLLWRRVSISNETYKGIFPMQKKQLGED